MARNPSVPPRVSGAPHPSCAGGQFGPVRRGWRGDGAASPEPPAPRPGVHNMSVPIPGKLPGVPREGGEGRLQKLSHTLPTLPITVSSSPGPSPPAAPHSCPARGARRPAAAAGQPELPAGKVSSSSARLPTPRAGPRGAVRSQLLRRLSGFRGCRCSRSCHSEGSDPARPPPRTAHTGASLAARIPALARVPEGTFLSRARPAAPPRPSRPGLRRPRTRGEAARELSAGRGPGRVAAPPRPLSLLGPQLSQGGGWSLGAEPGPSATGSRGVIVFFFNLFKITEVTRPSLLADFLKQPRRTYGSN